VEFHTFDFEIGPGAYLLHYHPNLNEHDEISQQLTMPNPAKIDELPIKEQNELRRLAKSTADKAYKTTNQWNWLEFHLAMSEECRKDNTEYISTLFPTHEDEMITQP
jgi:hypothetical protein